MFSSLFVLLLLCSACSKDNLTPAAPSAVNVPGSSTTVVGLDISGPNVIKGRNNQTVQLVATATYQDKTTKNVSVDPNITWSSDNEDVATVDKTGKVTSILYGDALISATIQHVWGSLRMTVSFPAVTRIEISGSTQAVSIGQVSFLRLLAHFIDGYELDQTVNSTWSSSDPSIATVNQGGIWTAVNFGSATITATYQGFTVSVGIKVEIPGGSGTPSIVFTSVPPFNSFGSVIGQVLHVNPANYLVEVYIYVGGGWWTKPYFTAPLTTISAGGYFVTDIATGGIDVYATSIAAFLVTKNHTPVTVGGSTKLPISVNGRDVIAVVQVNR
jgi:hypothetical protein